MVSKVKKNTGCQPDHVPTSTHLKNHFRPNREAGTKQRHKMFHPTAIDWTEILKRVPDRLSGLRKHPLKNRRFQRFQQPWPSHEKKSPVPLFHPNKSLSHGVRPYLKPSPPGTTTPQRDPFPQRTRPPFLGHSGTSLRQLSLTG